jgi:hypothetical protein
MRRAPILALLIAVAACIPPEKPAQSSKKDCPKPPPEPEMYAMVLATIHEYHLSTSGYPFSKLGDAMDAFRPDLVLVDAPPEFVKEGRSEEASVEVEYIKYVAGTRAGDVEPIDTNRVDPPILPVAEKEDEGTLQRDTSILDGMDSMSFEQANAQEVGLKILSALGAKARFQKGNPDFNRREAWLENNIDQIVARKKPKRVLAVVDVVNRPSIEAHFFTMGAGVKNPIEIVKVAKETREEGAVPSLVVKAWSQQLDRLRDRLSRMRKDSPEKQWLLQHVAVLQVAVDKQGACCVSPERLRVPDKKSR